MRKFQTFDGLNLAYLDEGAGLPVLCLAGLTRNSRDFDYIAPHLDDVRLIRMDYRGRGQSDWGDPDSYSITVEARDALALLDHLGLESAAILGTSRGGIIAMHLPATAGPRIRGVCLVDIGPVIELGGLALIKSFVGKHPPQKTFADAAKSRAIFYRDFKNVPMSRWLEEVQTHLTETGDGLRINYDPALAEVFNRVAVIPDDPWAEFDAMAGLPLALIRGANSDLLSSETAAEMRRRRPDMIFAEVPDRGHVPFLDEPEAVAAIRAWVERIE